MDPSPKSTLRLLLPRLPLILRTAVLNLLYLSKNSSKQNMIVEVTVVVLRSIMGVRRPMRFLQKVTTRDPGIKGPMWISKVTIPPPRDEQDSLDAVCRAIKELGNGDETYTAPEIGAVEAEWTGYRYNVPSSEPRPELAEDEHYKRLMSEVKSDVTLLYFHGGAYFLLDPSTVRDNTVRLAKLTAGRVYSVRYRLAPQNSFPAQLLDALNAYLSLLSPPPGAPHSPVSAKHIVFSGDSAGGNLATALLLLLLTLRRMGIETLTFHGKSVPLDLPAGVALNSPWVDISRSLPSIINNAHFDYLSPPGAAGESERGPIPDELWPSTPPRAEIFCSASMLLHPLTSPLAASPELWKGAPPVFSCLGNEGLEDEIEVLARRMHQGGVTVDLVGYEGMPHCFAMLFPDSEYSKDCYQRWTDFCSKVVEGRGPSASRAIWIQAFSKPIKTVEVPMEQVSDLTDADVMKSMRHVQSLAVKRESDANETWREQQTRAKL